MDERNATADFHIQAAPDAGAIAKLVLKHEESFLVCDRHGDFPAYLEGELGFYHEGTRHLRWLELRLNGGRPVLLGAEISPDNDQISIALTNADLTRVDLTRANLTYTHLTGQTSPTPTSLEWTSAARTSPARTSPTRNGLKACGPRRRARCSRVES